MLLPLNLKKKKKARKNGEIFPGKSRFFMCSYLWARKKLANTNFPVLSAIWDGEGYYVGGWCVWKKCRYAHQQAGLIFQSRWSLPISVDFSRDGGEISEDPTKTWTFLCPWAWTEGALQHSSRAQRRCLEGMDLSTWPTQPLSWIRAVLVSLNITCWLLLPSTDKTQINHPFKPRGHGRVNNRLQAGKKETVAVIFDYAHVAKWKRGKSTSLKPNGMGWLVPWLCKALSLYISLISSTQHSNGPSIPSGSWVVSLGP